MVLLRVTEVPSATEAAPSASGVARICNFGGLLSNFFSRYEFNMSAHKYMNYKTQLKKDIQSS